MKKIVRFLLIALGLQLFPVFLKAQLSYARRIVPAAALPASCLPGNGDVIFLTTGNIGMYQCLVTNTWAPVGLTNVAQQLRVTQGTIVTSLPFVTHTATWNAGGVTFTNFSSTVTDTASAAGSLLADFRVGANSIFSVGKAGVVTTAAAGSFGFLGQATILSPADGILNLTNNAGAILTRLSLGSSAVAYPAITSSPTVAGQAQGIIVNKADGTTVVFANLGAATNGSITYCSDCSLVNVATCTGAALGNCVCAAAGTGAYAKRLNGAWYCGFF